MAALDDLRVADLTTGVAGAMMGMLLSDFGAQIVKLVPPDYKIRDPESPGYACWDRNKSLLRGELVSPEVGKRFRQIVERSDVLLVDQDTAHLPQLGFDTKSLKASAPRLIVCHLPFYGDDPSWSTLRPDETVRSALTAVADMQHSHRPQPVVLVTPQISYAHAALAASALLAAVYRRRTTGVSDPVTVSGLHAFSAVQTGGAITAPGAIRPGPSPLGSFPHYRLYRCQDDKWLFLGSLTLPFFLRALDVLDMSEMMADSDVSGDFANLFNPVVGARVAERMESKFAERPLAEWEREFERAGVPIGPVGTREEWFKAEPIVASNMRWVSSDGGLEMPGVSPVLWRTPGRIAGLAAESTFDDVLNRWSVTQPADTESRNTGAGLPLSGVTVLDLGMFIAGTFAPTVLANFGADVIKIEPTDGDPFRTYGLIFAGYNRGKRSLAMDLKSEDGRALFLELVKNADVVLDNFRGGVAERLGIDPTALAAINPRVITCSVTGYGSGSAAAELPGFDPIMQARSGLMYAQGGGEEPVFHQMPINDTATALIAAFGILAALNERERSGQGQRVETSLAAQSVLFQSGEFTRFSGSRAPITGGPDFKGSPELGQVFECADGWLGIAGGTSLRAVLEAIGASWEAPSWSSVDEACRQRGRADLLATLEAHGLTAAPAHRLDDLLEATSLRGNRIFVAYDDPAYGRVTAIRGYAKFGSAECEFPRRTPMCGEHSVEVLSQFQVDADQVSSLHTRGLLVAAEPS